MSTKTTVGIVQMCAKTDVDANLDKVEELSSQAVAKGAKVVFLPEAFSYIGPERGRRPILESFDSDGPIFQRLKDVARNSQIDLIAGGFHEAASDGRAFNTCMHIDRNGQIEALYRKIHLFDVDLSDGTRMLESRSTCPGDRAVTTRLPFGVLGMTVCYDVRFPLLYQHLVDQGAIALTIPAAFMKSTGRDHWHVLLRARAIECQAYVIAPAQFGDHDHRGRKSYGHAMVVDPWGKVLAECPADEEGIAIAEIDPAEVERIRTELPSLSNRRAFN